MSIEGLRSLVFQVFGLRFWNKLFNTLTSRDFIPLMFYWCRSWRFGFSLSLRNQFVYFYCIICDGSSMLQHSRKYQRNGDWRLLYEFFGSTQQIYYFHWITLSRWHQFWRKNMKLWALIFMSRLLVFDGWRVGFIGFFLI